MQAIHINQYGGPEVLTVRDIDKPVAKDTEVLVKIYASAVTQADVMMRTGTPWFGRLIIGLRAPKAKVPGTAFAGKIEAVGKDVTRFAVGDDVFGETTVGFHAHAQYVAVAEDGVIERIPLTMNYEEAAPLPDGALTIYNFLTNLMTVRPGMKVLINGAAGGLGTSAVQLAKHRGAEVTAVASGRNAGLLRQLGADHIIDYTQEDFTRGGARYDVIFDTVGKVPFRRARRGLRKGGVYLSPVLGLGLLFQMLWTSRFGRRGRSSRRPASCRMGSFAMRWARSGDSSRLGRCGRSSTAATRSPRLPRPIATSRPATSAAMLPSWSSTTRRQR